MRPEQEIRADLAAVQSTIDQAYWDFTRCAKALPPVMVVPEAYQRRKALREDLGGVRRHRDGGAVEGFEFLVGGDWTSLWGSGGQLGAGCVAAVNAGHVDVEDVCDQLLVRAAALGHRVESCRPVHTPQHGRPGTVWP